jgi:hypothetical protein
VEPGEQGPLLRLQLLAQEQASVEASEDREQPPLHLLQQLDICRVFARLPSWSGGIRFDRC